jgi:3-methyladenine DNA glycosylase AlkD
LYIWTGNAYCKINGVLEDTLSDLADKFQNNSELSNTEFAELAEQIEKMDKETKQEFIDTYAQIEMVAST